jgi:hypothetical protein
MNRIPFALIILGLSETYTGIAIHQVLIQVFGRVRLPRRRGGFWKLHPELIVKIGRLNSAAPYNTHAWPPMSRALI